MTDPIREFDFHSLPTGPGHLDPDDMNQLVIMVAGALEDGDSEEQIANDLVNGGWTQNEAYEFVLAIQYQIEEFEAPAEKEGNPWGWLVGIGIFLILKILSQIFD